jgi:hypothetical protein
MLNSSDDKRLIALLLKYNSLSASIEAQGAKAEWERQHLLEHPAMPPATLKEMIAAGIAFELEAHVTHDDAVERCFKAYNSIEKAQVVRHFVAGLANDRPDWRAGLSAYAMMLCMPDHKFRRSDAGFCAVCSAPHEYQVFDKTALNLLRFHNGAITALKTPFEVSFYLEQEVKLEAASPDNDSWSTLHRLLEFISSSKPSGPANLAKAIRAVPGIRVSLDQARGIVDTLGMCGILRTAEHPGYNERYTNPGLAPSKRHASGWSYPVDFWTGEDGVDRSAVRYWFDQ